ncbi:MAG TPA: response regulator transcription factor [Acidimicrobiales bacterium]
MHVLVVEDDEPIASALVSGLQREGFAAESVGSAAEALNSLPADFILLDLGLPDRDGIELFRNLRAVSAAPIIMVTARGAEEDRIAGLDLGADDYVVKPFGVRELVARINAVMRRSGAKDAEAMPVQVIDGIEIDRRVRTVCVSGEMIACTPKEYGILEFLARDPGAVITRQELLDGVWGPHWYGATKMMDVHVASLRRKLGSPDVIETIRGVGFKLVVQV